MAEVLEKAVINMLLLMGRSFLTMNNGKAQKIAGHPKGCLSGWSTCGYTWMVKANIDRKFTVYSTHIYMCVHIYMDTYTNSLLLQQCYDKQST